jgi:hypothetical protein
VDAGLAAPSGYNGLVPRRGAQVGLLLLFLGLPVLTLGPFQLGTLRLVGVSLAWWYALVVAPVAALLITLLTVPPTRRPREQPAGHRPDRRGERAVRRRPVPRASGR